MSKVENAEGRGAGRMREQQGGGREEVVKK